MEAPPKDKRTKEIIGYEGLYSITDYGDVISHERYVVRPMGNNYTIPHKILKQKSTKAGYQYVSLYKNKSVKNYYIHRLVGIHFCENPNNKKTIDHLDFDKTNNHYTNLEWVSQRENIARHVRAKRHFTPGKLVLDTLNGIFHKSISEAARSTNMTRKNLSMMLNGKTRNKSNFKLV